MLKTEVSLMSRMVKAIPEAVVNARALSQFTESLREDHGNDLKQWEQQLLEWENGTSAFCPYDVPESG